MKWDGGEGWWYVLVVRNADKGCLYIMMVCKMTCSVVWDDASGCWYGKVVWVGGMRLCYGMMVWSGDMGRWYVRC